MRKYIILTLVALFVMVGIASATNIPVTVEPKNRPTVWTETVYNGSGADITSGYIVEWDFDASDSTALDGTWYDDMCSWVQLADSAGDIWTAGVVAYGKNIVNGTPGRVIIRGPAYVVIGSTLTADDIVEADASGKVVPHDGAATDEGTLGVCIKATTTNGPGGGFGVIYVNPLQYDKD